MSADTDPWVLRFTDQDSSVEAFREAICTLANGYWGSRGAASESFGDARHRPGTFLAGVYDRSPGTLGGGRPDVEALVNGPNWLPLRFRPAEGDWLHPDTTTVLAAHQELDLRSGILSRMSRYRDASGRTTRVSERRFLSLASPHVAVSETTFEPEDWAGGALIRSELDGRVENRGDAADTAPQAPHLRLVSAVEATDDVVVLELRTRHSDVTIAMAQRTRIQIGDGPPQLLRLSVDAGRGRIGHECELDVVTGCAVTVVKTVIVATSLDRAIGPPRSAVARWMDEVAPPAELEAAHRRSWTMLWADFAVCLPDQPEQTLALNLNTFHVLQSLAPEVADLDVGIPARGLHGEGYRGHIFWDEMFVYPMLTLRRPSLSRSLMGYRYRRLNEARSAARRFGTQGAMFPWRSGADGRELTPSRLFNPRSNTWMADNSFHQRHVGLAVAYSVWQHYQATGDTDLLVLQGAELMIEVARFFVGIAEHDPGDDRYDISGVMGPDEFHDGYPGSPGGGVRNNAYTNVLTAWLLGRVEEVMDLLAGRDCGALWDRIDLRAGEREHWARVRRRLRVVFHADGVISQFDGYEALPELDWKRYRREYAQLGRLDLILSAEGENTNDYRVSKQADALMLLYLFSAEELRALLADLGYDFPPGAVIRTVDFYTARSTNGSTLGNLVESWVEARRDRSASWEYFTRALDSDLHGDADGSTTSEGVHLGAMAGTVDLAIRCYAGLEIRDDALWFHPVLPEQLRSLSFVLVYRGLRLQVAISQTHLCVSIDAGSTRRIAMQLNGRRVSMIAGQSGTFSLTSESEEVG